MLPYIIYDEYIMRAVNRESSCFVSLDAAAAAVRCLLETIRLVAVFVIVA